MSCRSFERRIALWVGGDLEPARAAAVERHLEGCAGCRDRAETMRRSLAALRALDARACEGLDGVRLRPLAPRVGRRRRLAAPLAVATAVTAAVLVSAVVVALLDRRPSPARPEPVRVARLSAPAARPAEPVLRRPGTGGPRVVPPPLPSPAVVAPEGVAAVAPGLDRTPESAPAAAQAASYTIKVLTEDPDIVIYWVVDPKGARYEPQDT